MNEVKELLAKIEEFVKNNRVLSGIVAGVLLFLMFKKGKNNG